MSFPDEIHSQFLAVYCEAVMSVQHVRKLLSNGYPCCWSHRSAGIWRTNVKSALVKNRWVNLRSPIPH